MWSSGVKKKIWKGTKQPVFQTITSQQCGAVTVMLPPRKSSATERIGHATQRQRE